MAAALAGNGFAIASSPDGADIILVNTCAFILPAKEESIDEILRMAELKKAGKCSRLVVTGCLPQRYGKSLARELPEVDLFLGMSELPAIAGRLETLMQDCLPPSRSLVGQPTFLMNADHPRLISTPFYSAFLKIADGCSNWCSYCVIPAIRGKARSRTVDDIVKEAGRLTAGGVKEIIITAQDTTAYGRDLKGKPTLAALLRELAGITELRWIRLLYTYPAGLTEEMLETVAQRENICNYLDVPIQHIDDDILKTMNRRGGSRTIKQGIAAARSIIPGVALRTSLIVGFPGETRARFNRLLSFVRETRFDHLGVFEYSREEETPAASFPAQVTGRTKKNRRRLIMEEQAMISQEINRSLVGSRQEILIEGESDIPGYRFTGRCRRQAPDIDGITYVKGRNLSTGMIVEGMIIAGEEYDLFAEVPGK
jgi:ribosomal protein S12 methylthiotransferase